MDFDKIVAGVKMMIDGIGDDALREGLVDTPVRVAAIWKSFFDSENISDKEILKLSFGAENYGDFILVRNIQFSSFCEHHLLPFFGKISVAYIPKNGSVVGLSKLARVVAKYSKRLQLQERLTRQIADAIGQHTANGGVFVLVAARHVCMTARGIVQPGAEVITRAMCGEFLLDKSIVADVQQLIFSANG
ncbi:MAG: GTP cyclohydrolase I FolE [Puniceicoccales bacterium]|jgi:GTP cyclohydrolase I|nr:GTP cyclohydrolase I FolE [Puniceicoccales bacterium]